MEANSSHAVQQCMNCWVALLYSNMHVAACACVLPRAVEITKSNLRTIENDLQRLVQDTCAAGHMHVTHNFEQMHCHKTERRIIQTILQNSQAHAPLWQLPETDQAQQACQQAAGCLSAASEAPVSKDT